jgi:hypothetical protein
MTSNQIRRRLRAFARDGEFPDERLPSSPETRNVMIVPASPKMAATDSSESCESVWLAMTSARPYFRDSHRG